MWVMSNPSKPVAQPSHHTPPRSFGPMSMFGFFDDTGLKLQHQEKQEGDIFQQQDNAFRLETMVSTLSQQMCEAKEKWSEILFLVSSHQASADKRMTEHHGQVQDALRQHTTSLMLLNRPDESDALQDFKERLDTCLHILQKISEKQDLADECMTPRNASFGQLHILQKIPENQDTNSMVVDECTTPRNPAFREQLQSTVTEGLRQVNEQLDRIEASLHNSVISKCNGYHQSDKLHTFDQTEASIEPVAQVSLRQLSDEKASVSQFGSLTESIASTGTFEVDLRRSYNVKKMRHSSMKQFTDEVSSHHVPAGVSKKYASGETSDYTRTFKSYRHSWINDAVFEAHMKGRSVIFQWVLQRLLCIHTWWLSLREPKRQGRLAYIVQSNVFEGICICVILFNSIFVAYVANWSMENLSDVDSIPAADYVEVSLLVFYTVELCMRMCVHRLYLFINEDFIWNIFDFALVVTSLIDYVLRLISDSMGENVFVMRLVRFLKLARALRALRAIRFCKELLNLLTSMKNSFVSLFWLIVLLFMSLYIFAVIFLQALTYKMKDNRCFDETCTDYQIVQENFGTMAIAMLSLIMAMTGGKEWALYYDVVQLTGKFYAALFLVFIFFVMFAMINIMGAIFVEKAMEAAAPDREGKILEQRRKNIEDAASFREMCHKIVGPDKPDKDTITWTEFRKALREDEEKNKDELLLYMASIGLQLHDVRLFFEIIAGAGDEDEVSIDRFVEGCMQMTGTATAIDMQRQLYQTDRISADLKKFHHLVLSQLRELKKQT